MRKGVESWLPYLEGVSWRHFATFTTSKPITVKGARKLMEQVAFQVLRPDERMFWAAEPFQLGVREGSYHVHALLETRWSAKQVQDWWQEHFGHAIVKRYNPTRGAVHYVAKYLTKSAHDYDLLVGKTRREKRLEYQQDRIWNS